MKKFLQTCLLMFLMLAASALNAQVLQEGFEGTSFPPADWTIDAQSTSYSWISASSSPYEGSKYASFKGNTRSVYTAKLISPVMDISTVAGPSLSFYHTQKIWFSDQNILRVYYRTAATETWTLLQEWTNSIPDWQFEEINLPNPSATYQIAFEGESHYGYEIKLDAVEVAGLPSCPKPTDLAVSNVTTTTAQLAWTAGGSETEWTIDCNGTEITTTTNPYTLTDLTTNTAYAVKVRANCTEDDQSIYTNTVNFRTECDLFAVSEATPYQESFDGTDFPPACWSRAHTAGTSSSQWIRTTSPVHTGAGAAKLEDQATGNRNDLVTAMLNIPEANAYQVSFWVNRSTYSSVKPNEGVKVWVNTTPDTVGATEIAYIHREYTLAPAEVAIGWYQYEAVIPTAGNMYVIFQGISEFGAATTIDDISVEKAPTCLRPTDLTFSKINATTAQVAWTANSNETEWMLDYNGTKIVVNDNPYSLTNLTPNTNYTVSVRAICSETDTSDWSASRSFRTQCAPIAITETTPYTEDFSGYTGTSYSTAGVMPECWDYIYSGTNGNYAPHVYDNTSYYGTYYSPNDNNALFFCAYDGAAYGTANYVVMPAFENPMKTLQIKFAYSHYASSAASTLTLGYIVEANDPSTFTELAVVPHVYYSTNRYNEFEYVINNDQIPEGARLAFFTKNPTTTTDYTFIDDIEVSLKPSCLKPTQVAVANITTNSAEISWQDNNEATQWEVKLGDSTFVVTNNSYSLTNLTPNTRYQLQIRTLCSESDNSEWTSSVTFKTACDIMTIVEGQPYTEDFTDYTATTSGTTLGVMPDCWDYLYAGTDEGAAPHVYKGTYGPNGSSNNCLVMVAANSATYGANTYAIFPPFTNDLSGMILSFKERHENSSNGDLTIGYIENEDSTTYQVLETIPRTTTGTVRTTTLPTIPQGARLAFRWEQINSTYWYSVYIDDISLRMLSSQKDIVTFRIPEETSPAVIDNENHTVTVEVSYNARIDSLRPIFTISQYATVTPASGVYQDFTTPFTYTVTAEDSTTQEWVVTVNALAAASTENNIVNFTFSNQVGEAVIDTVAHTVNASTTWNAANLNIRPTITVSPLATISPISGTLRDFTNPVTYIVTAEDTTYQQEWTVSIIRDTAACPNPLASTINIRTTVDSAIATWNKRYLETAYNVKVSTTNITPATATADIFDGTVTDTTFAIGNLQANTLYYAYLQADCGTDEWLSTTFRTECDLFAVSETTPYQESFDGTDFPPACWSRAHTAGTSTTQWTRSIYTVHTGAGAAYLAYHATGNRNDLVTGLLKVPEANAYQVSFWMYRNTSATSSYLNEGIKVWVNSTPDTINGTQIAYIHRAYNLAPAEAAMGWYRYEAVIPTNGLMYVIFQGITENGYAMYIDDISVEKAPTCLKPTDVTVANITPTSAEISWTANSEETEWQLNLNGTLLTADSNPFVVNDLTEETNYTMAVRAICSETDSSDWSAEQSFYTGICIPAPTSVDGDGITHVTFGNDLVVNNSTHPTAQPYFGDYTDQIGSVAASMDVTVSITYETGYSYGTVIWVNWNNDLAFDESEIVYYGQSASANPTTLNATFTVPANTPIGNYRMRIGGADNKFDNEDDLNPCLSTTYTIYEDYTLQVTEAPACIAPSAITISNITPYAAEISWITNSDETAWQLRFNDSIINVNDNPFTLTDLTENTDYAISLRAICSESDTSDWSTVQSFYTGVCIPAPTTVDHNGITHVTFGNDLVVNNSTHPTAQPYFGDYTDQIGSVAASMDVTVSITYETGYSYGTVIWVNWNNDLAFDESEIVYYGQSASANPTTLNATFTVPANTPIGNYRMRIGGADSEFDDENDLDPCLSTGYTIYEDYTLQVTEVPTCIAPSAITISNIADVAAEISWTTNSEETAWQLRLNDSIINVNDNPFTLTDLTENTDYAISLRAICSESDTSNWSNVVDFTTTCSVFAVTETTPYQESFDGTDFPPACWSRAHTAGTSSSQWIRTTSPVHTGAGAAKLEDQATGNRNDLVTAMLNIPEPNAYQVSFWVNRSTYSTVKPNEGVKVWVNTTPDTVGATEIAYIHREYTLAPAEVAIGWYQYEAVIPTAGNMYVIFQGISEFGAATTIDDISVEKAPTCLKPTAVTVSNIFTTYAQIAWTNGGEETEWTIDYNGAEVVANTNPFTLTGLQPATEYTVKVRANCAADDVSAWSSTTTFATECDIITTFPYFQDFTSEMFPPICWFQERTEEGAGSGYNDYPDGAWTRTTTVQGGNNTPMAQLRDTRAGSKHNLVTGAFNLTNADGYLLSVDVYRNATGTSYTEEGIKIYASNSPAIDATSEELAFISRNFNVPSTVNANIVGAETASGWYTYELPIMNTNGVAYIIFEGNSQYGSSTFMDNIILMEMPTCYRPTDVTVSNITDSTAEVAWTSNGEETEWIINLNGTEIFANSNPFTLTGLTERTSYTLTVAAYCGVGDTSIYSLPVTFRTPCSGAFTVTTQNPFIEDFTGYETTESVSTFSSQPDCWDFIFTGTTVGYTPHVYNGTYAPNTGDNALVMASQSPTYAALPALTNDLNTLEISFKTKMESASSGTLAFGYMTDVTDAATFVSLAPIPSATTAATHVLIFAEENFPAGARFAFSWTHTSTTSWYVGIDDIVITLGCEVPANLQVDENYTVTWEAGEATHWELRYIIGTDTTILPVTNNIYTLTNLPDSVDVTVSVRAICDATHVSAWSEGVTFNTTPEDPGVGVVAYNQVSARVFPNPTREVINVQLSMNQTQMASSALQLFDIYGRMLLTMPVEKSNFTIDMTHFAPGVYFLRVVNATAVLTNVKVVKE